ncbi:nucleotidyltransferase domain-containing protein [Candidatus Woesearchaeota archaeon]|nr:nucleotidyltransferase domain-containing protein [Candidatus Woesearchaeota archaeon]
MDKKTLRKDFAFLKDKVLGILLFGSQLKDPTPRSDIDICIVAPSMEDSQVLSEVFRNIDVHRKKYDVRTFHELPLHIKNSIINHHEEIFVNDKPALYEYFYFYRKLWGGQKHRNDAPKEEILAMM